MEWQGDGETDEFACQRMLGPYNGQQMPARATTSAESAAATVASAMTITLCHSHQSTSWPHTRMLDPLPAASGYEPKHHGLLLHADGLPLK